MHHNRIIILAITLIGFISTAQELYLPKSIIGKPEVSQFGNIHLNFPIELPKDVGEFMPNVTLNYNNQGGNTFLGLGWNYDFVSISLDTRWGTPIFDPLKETELYLFEGNQLMFPNNYLPHRHQYINMNGNSVPVTTQQERNNFIEVLNNNIQKKIFQPRLKSGYVKVERYGNSPSSYYWKVIKTDGTIIWLGGDENGIDDNYTLKNPTSNNICKWLIKKSIDAKGSFIIYEYEVDLHNNKIYKYPKKIKYTGIVNKSTGQIIRQPNYFIEFSYDLRSVNESETDEIIDARDGVVTLLRKKLSNIKVVSALSGSIFREYDLEYKIGEFNKLLLKKIIEKRNNQYFFSHEMDYFNDVEDGLYTDWEDITKRSTSAGVNYTSIIQDPISSILNNGYMTSGIESSSNIEYGVEGRLALGIEVRPLIFKVTNKPEKNFTIGLPIGIGKNNSRGKLSLTDVNGDGIDDILLRKYGGLYFYPRKVKKYWDSNTNSYKSEIIIEGIRNISGINDFSKSEGTTVTLLGSIDLKASILGYNLNAGKKLSSTKNESLITMTDGNGDGIVDFIKDDCVLFGKIDNNGDVSYTTDSSLTENMVITASTSEEEEDNNDDEINNTVHDFDYDAVITYIVGHTSSKVNITNHYNIESDENKKAVVSIEHYNKSSNVTNRIYLSELNFQHQQADATILNFGLQAGDKLFFRVHKLYENDTISKVFQNPKIEFISGGSGGSGYSSETPSEYLIGANGENSDFTQTNYSQHGFYLSSEGNKNLEAGTYSIKWDAFTVNYPSDNVVFKIVLIDPNSNTEEIIYEKVCNMGTNNNVIAPSANILNLVLNTEKMVVFKVMSDTNVKWNEMKWSPKIDLIQSSTEGLSSSWIVFPEYSIYRTACSDNYSLYGRNLLSQNVDSSGQTRTYGIKPKGIVTNEINPNYTESDNGKRILLVVKKNGLLVEKRIIMIFQGALKMFNYTSNLYDEDTYIENNTPINIYTGNLSSTGNIFYNVEYYGIDDIEDEFFERYWQSLRIILGYNWNLQYNNCQHPFEINSCGYSTQYASANLNNYEHLGTVYNNWGQFFYKNKGNGQAQNTDIYGQIIDNDIVEHPIDMNLFNSSFLNGNYQTADEAQAALLNSLNLPTNPGVLEDNDSSMDNMLGNYSNINQNIILLPATATSSTVENNPFECWQGIFDSQYIAANEAKTGELSNSSYGEFSSNLNNEYQESESTLITNQFTGMYGILGKSISKTHSYRVGATFNNYGISRSWSNTGKNNQGYSYEKSGFIDINGDRYPDMVFDDGYQSSTMTGGHRPKNTINWGNFSNNASNNKGNTLSFNLAYLLSRPEKNETNINFKKFLMPTSGSLSSLHRASLNNAFPSEIINNGIPTIGLSLNSNLDGENISTSFWGDINGDGLLDHIKNINGVYKYKLNDGYNFLNNSSSFQYEGYENLFSNTTKPATDNVEFPSPFNIETGINQILGALFSNSPVGISIASGKSKGNFKKMLIDYNSDGLTDMLVEQNGLMLIYLNNGKGLFPYGEINFNLNASTVSKSISLNAQFSKFFGKRIWTFWICIPFPFIGCLPFPVFTIWFKYGIEMSGNASYTQSETMKSFKDINGDGYPDLLEQLQNGNLRVKYSKIARTNMLKSVTNSIGTKYTFNFESEGNTYNLPMPKWVLRQMDIQDKNSNITNSISSYRYYYYNGYYDRRERDFYGFERVKVAQIENSLNIYTNDGKLITPLGYTVQKFNNRSYYLKGNLLESWAIQDDYMEILSPEFDISNDKIKNHITQNYTLYGVHTDGNLNLSQILDFNFDSGGTKGLGIAAPLLTSTKTESFESSVAPYISTENFVYDKKGRIVSSTSVESNNSKSFYYPESLINEPFAQQLIEENRISEPLQMEINDLSNNQVQRLTKSTTEYNRDITSTSGLLVPIKNSSAKSNLPLEVDNEINLYDSYGNILQTTNNFGTPKSVIWGYNGALPVITIEGIKYADLPHSLVTNIQQATNENQSISNLHALYNQLINHPALRTAFAKCYTYNPLVGVTSELSSNGTALYYLYDEFDRLSEVRDTQNRSVKKSYYKYQEQP